MQYEHHFTRNPAICNGDPVFAGTRVTLRTILSSLAEGASMDEVLRDFPSLTLDSVRAAVAFAASAAVDDMPLPQVPRVT